MKLNYDAVRDVLLYLEENLVYSNKYNLSMDHIPIDSKTVAKTISDKKTYQQDEVLYAVEKLAEAGLIAYEKAKQRP